jgi:hypothetical protein
MVGVHANPQVLKTHPTGDLGVYGLSISNNMNGWITLAGVTTYKSERKINPLDTINLKLDCDKGKFTVTHKEWNAEIVVPVHKELFPYFDPYDLDFELIG